MLLVLVAEMLRQGMKLPAPNFKSVDDWEAVTGIRLGRGRDKTSNTVHTAKVSLQEARELFAGGRDACNEDVN